LAWHGRTAGRDEHEKTGPRDLVSRADLETEQVIRRLLAHRRPHDTVLGEEGGVTGGADGSGSTGIEWLVDPIDGTTSYLYGRADWSVSVAARDAEGRVVAAAVAEPAYGRLTSATLGGGTWQGGTRYVAGTGRPLRAALVEVNFGRPGDQHPLAGAMVDALLPEVRDLRRTGSAASCLAAVATGRADAAWVPGLQPWDGAAGMLLALEAGAVAGDLAGPSEGRWPTSGDLLAAPSELWEALRDRLLPVYARRSTEPFARGTRG